MNSKSFLKVVSVEEDKDTNEVPFKRVKVCEVEFYGNVVAEGGVFGTIAMYPAHQAKRKSTGETIEFPAHPHYLTVKPEKLYIGEVISVECTKPFMVKDTEMKVWKGVVFKGQNKYEIASKATGVPVIKDDGSIFSADVTTPVAVSGGRLIDTDDDL